MKRIYFGISLILIVFSLAFTGGVISASGEEGNQGTQTDPWFSVRQNNPTVLKPAISAVATYGDLDRGCRCFPLTDDDINGTGTCEELPLSGIHHQDKPMKKSTEVKEAKK